MLPLVIGSHPGSPWLQWWVEKPPEDRTVFVHRQGGYEPAALLAAMEHFDRFLFLHDSTRILSPDFWTVVEPLEATWLTGHPPMFMAVHDTAQLEPHRLKLEQCDTKEQTIELESELPSLVAYETLWPKVTDHTASREHMHGRDNLVLSNRYFAKYKGTWR